MGLGTLQDRELNKFTEVNGQPVVSTTSVGSIEYTIKIIATGVYTYIGYAPIASNTSSAVWRIKRTDETLGLTVLFADGNDNFDNVWNNYAILTYL